MALDTYVKTLGQSASSVSGSTINVALRTWFQLKNVGMLAIYVGADDVTPATGAPVAPGRIWALDALTGSKQQVYAVSETGISGRICVIETS